ATRVHARDVVVGETSGTAHVVLTFDPPPASAYSINYRTENGTAMAGRDYVAMNGSLSVAVGQTQQAIDIPIMDDGASEGDKTFALPSLRDTLPEDNQTVAVNPSAPANATIATASATVTIINDDIALPPRRHATKR